MANPWDVAYRATVGNVLALARLSSAQLLGGRTSGDKQVAHVRFAPEGRRPVGDFEHTVVLLDGRRLTDDNFLVDLTLRWMGEAGAPLLVVVTPAHEVGLSARRLADKLSVGLVVTTDYLLELADAIREVVEAPRRLLAATIVDAVDRLGRVSAARGVEDLLGVVEDTLHAQATLIGMEGEAVLGRPLEPPVPARDRLPVPVRTADDAVVRLVQPVTLARGEPVTFWLVLSRLSPTRAWEEAASRIIRLTASYVATRLMSNRLEQERDARVRLGALNAIIALTDRPSAALTQQIGTLGWKTDGWCTAVHLRVGGSADALRVLSLTDALRQFLTGVVTGPIVERPDGWTTWSTQASEPQPATFGALVSQLRRAVQSFVADREGLRVYVGIGRPYAGVLGLRKSLAEAQEAATIAQAGGLRTAVQHIDELGVQRILVGWYTSQEFGDFARTLLRPVTDIDKDDDLLRTLEVYLDNESSPTATADIMGLHRNTVIKRVARVREVLAVELDDPDQRLAVQLACRVVNLAP